MTARLAKLLGVSEDRASRMIRTFWQSFIALLLSTFLLLANSLLDLVKGQSTGTTAAVITMVLTVLVSIIKNIQDSKKDDNDGDAG